MVVVVVDVRLLGKLRKALEAAGVGCRAEEQEDEEDSDEDEDEDDNIIALWAVGVAEETRQHRGIVGVDPVPQKTQRGAQQLSSHTRAAAEIVASHRTQHSARNQEEAATTERRRRR